MGLLKNLDLFITVSNSTAHFAGALGIPTILICPKKSSTYFYWNTSSESSIWYTNIKVLGIENSISKTIEQINNIVEKNNEFNIQGLEPEITIISPKPGEEVLKNDLFIALSYFKVKNIDISNIKIFLDDEDVKSKSNIDRFINKKS